MRERLRQFRELSKLFFGRFLDNDLISLDGDTKGTLLGVLGLIAAPGLFVPMFEFVMYSSVPLCDQPWWARDLVAAADKVLHVGLSMTVLGVVTVLEWEALLPDRRDYAVLKPLPVGMGTLLGAKVWALAKFWLLFTVLLNGVAMVLFPAAVLQNSSMGLLAWYIRCHALTVLAGNAFIFLAMIAVQGVLLNVLGWRGYRRWAPYAQSILIAALAGMFFLSLGISLDVDPNRGAYGVLRYLPPVWFMGLYERELGWTQQGFRELAGQALGALGLAAVLAIGAYAVSYGRSARQLFEQGEGPGAAPGRLRLVFSAAVNRVLLRSTGERAAFHFVCDTLSRSRSHRLLVGGYAGLGLAIVFQSFAGMMAAGVRTWWQSPSGLLLPAQLVLGLFLLAGMRYSFSVPAELKANWIFQTAGALDGAECLRGVRKAVLATGIMPLYIVLGVVHVWLWGWQAGMLHTLYGVVVAWMTLEVMLVGMEKLPFTCSYVAGKTGLKSSWPLFVAGYVAYVGAFSFIELRLQAKPLAWAGFAAMTVLVKVSVEWYRRRAADEFALVFDERAEPAVRTLDLAQ
jgi:hypothetical protein